MAEQKQLYWLFMAKKYCMTDKEIEENMGTIIHSIVAFAAQYSDDPEMLAILLTDATTLVLGIAELELEPVFKRMTELYPNAVRAGVSLQGYPNITQ